MPQRVGHGCRLQEVSNRWCGMTQAGGTRVHLYFSHHEWTLTAVFQTRPVSALRRVTWTNDSRQTAMEKYSGEVPTGQWWRGNVGDVFWQEKASIGNQSLLVYQPLNPPSLSLIICRLGFCRPVTVHELPISISTCLSGSVLGQLLSVRWADSTEGPFTTIAEPL